MAVVTVKKIKGSTLALDCSSTKSGITIINEYGTVIFASELSLIYRSMKKVKIPHLETKSYLSRPDGELTGKTDISALVNGEFTFINKAEVIHSYLLGLIEEYDVKCLAIEDYAYFKSTGKLLDIVEMTGVMKYLITANTGIEWVRVAPTAIKSFLAGSHTASKSDMVGALEHHYGIVIESHDVVDSYTLAMLIHRLRPHLKNCVEKGILRSSYKEYL